MDTNGRLTQKVKRVRDAVARAARAATKEGTGTHVNIEQPTNIKVARNICREGGTAHASATQVTPVVQSQRDEPR